MTTTRLNQVSPGLDELDRRIMAALQVEGRASWRRVATVLGESERTVARRGNRLLEERLVVVAALTPQYFGAYSEPTVVSVRCFPGTARVAGASLARRQDTTFSYIMTGTTDCVAEVWCPADRLTDLLLEELPSTPGMARIRSDTVLHYYRTVHEWQPGILADDEAAALAADRPLPPTKLATKPPLAREDRVMVDALARDGRATHAELGRLAGVSEATARRRVDALRTEGDLTFRAVVEPATLGLPVEALLWISTPPGSVDRVGEQLLASPLVRYVAAITGPHQLLVDVTLPTKAALRDMITGSPWVEHVSAVETTLVVQSLKRGGVLSDSTR
ncbi:Lrp/AsnC family transcriptional regulator [Saccharomonospora iraqiensis]|uniref:Lrp/AsnC family transcriptional regulator n=1 Tax=Saccharomonospora iraqiensis TaxID=52698 RepID=UPI000697A553|nr:AsnC family transcriptional regulator [Saccharomonospora iraqiensis]